MAYKYVGNDCIDRAGLKVGGNTIITLIVPASARGILKEGYLYANAAGNAKIKVFRDDGTNYVFVGESPSQAVVQGVNNLNIWVPVEVGDLIGYWSDVSVEANLSGGSARTKAGDVTTTTLKTSWGTEAYIHSVLGVIFKKVGVF